MSKIGKLPITIPSGITVNLDGRQLTVSNPQNQLQLTIPNQIELDIKDDQILVTRLSEAKKVKSNHGTIRALIQNMITGLITPWQKNLEILGTGYKAAVNDQKISLTVGFIKPVDIVIPSGITVTVDGGTKIKITGIDIRYADEFIKLKPGKTAKTEV